MGWFFSNNNNNNNNENNRYDYHEYDNKFKYKKQQNEENENNQQNENNEENDYELNKNKLEKSASTYDKVTVSLTNKNGKETYKNVPIWDLQDDEEIEEFIDYEKRNGNDIIIINMIPDIKNLRRDRVLYRISFKLYSKLYNKQYEDPYHIEVDEYLHNRYNGNLNEILKELENFTDKHLQDKTLKHTLLEKFDPPFEYTLNTSVKGGRYRKTRKSKSKSKNKNKKRKTNKRRR